MLLAGRGDTKFNQTASTDIFASLQLQASVKKNICCNKVVGSSIRYTPVHKALKTDFQIRY